MSAAFSNKMLNRRELIKFSPRPRGPRQGFWLHVSRAAMACRFEVTLPLRERAGVSVAQGALDEIDRLERQLTIFRETSEVSFLNRNCATSTVRVEPSLFALLLLCQQLHRETRGAFDITSAPLSRCWGFLRREGRLPDPAEIEEARSVVGGDKVILDEGSRAVRFEHPGVEINLGSIGKGYALDRIEATMRGRVQAALLSAGASSIRAIGRGDGRQGGWIVGIRHPRDKKRRLAVLRVRDCALSTSGSEEQYFEHDGKRFGHIIDPRAGRPAEIVSGVTVIAQSAAVADALATAFYVGGPRLAEAYCSSHPDTLVIMLESGADRPALFGSNNRCEVEIAGE
jgi:thiamine biosynthesis lipoprotein